MRYIFILFLVGCSSNSTEDSCIPFEDYKVLSFVEIEGDCGELEDFNQQIKQLPQCDSILETDMCNYELIDNCDGSYEELFLDFNNNVGVYYLETENCSSLYEVEL